MFATGSPFRAAGILGPDVRRNAHVCAILTQSLARRGSRVLVVDEAPPPYNVAGMMGYLARGGLGDVPTISLVEAAQEIGVGMRLMAAFDGVHALARLNAQTVVEMSEEWGEDKPDWMLLNGLGGNKVVGLANSAEFRILVLPGAISWLAESYATLKAAHTAMTGGQWMVLVEGASPDAAQRLYQSLQETSMHFLGFAPGYLGCLPRDDLGRRTDESVQAGLLAEALLAVQGDSTISFEQYWQRLWLYSRMELDSPSFQPRDAKRRKAQ